MGVSGCAGCATQPLCRSLLAGTRGEMKLRGMIITRDYRRGCQTGGFFESHRGEIYYARQMSSLGQARTRGGII